MLGLEDAAVTADVAQELGLSAPDLEVRIGLRRDVERIGARERPERLEEFPARITVDAPPEGNRGARRRQSRERRLTR